MTALVAGFKPESLIGSKLLIPGTAAQAESIVFVSQMKLALIASKIHNSVTKLYERFIKIMNLVSLFFFVTIKYKFPKIKKSTCIYHPRELPGENLAFFPEKSG